jgi:CDP-diacylglycerol--glycerol-3-phosphate 3-phosphatidyltransferase/cardiolipin synthase
VSAPTARPTIRPTAPFAVADGITLARIPLALMFIFAANTPVRLAILSLTAATDLGDGWVARRFGSSRIGAVLDPIADRLFMAAAFGVVLFSGRLEWWEVVAVLARDIIASVAFFVTLATGRVTAVPARAGGKAVTLLQLLTLFAFVLDSPLVRHLAWSTAAVGLYAIWDYNRHFFRELKNR